MMHVLMILFLAATVLWLLYWAVVRESILNSVQDDLANLRDQVAWNIINDLPGSRSKAAQRLMEEVDVAKFVRLISFSHVAFYLFQNRTKIKTEAVREMSIFEASPKWMRDARELNVRLTIKAALANSPLWWIPLPIILLSAVFSKQVLDWWNDTGSSASQLRSIHLGISQPA